MYVCPHLKRLCIYFCRFHLVGLSSFSCYIFQAFYYAWLMCREESRPISPSLFFVRQNGYDGDDDTLLMNKQPVTDFRTQAADEFEGKMNELLEEIFHSDVPYTQSPDLNSCKNCDFCAICGRRPQEY